MDIASVPVPLARVRRGLILGGTIWWSLTVLSLCAAIATLGFVFVFVLVQGLPALRPSIFVTVTSGIAGGLANAIAGTLLLVMCAFVLASAVGIGTGVWVVQYSVRPWAEIVRFVSDVLAGVPSIVIGYFGYVVFVERLGWHFSLAAGGIALMLVMLPYVVRGTDQALSAVPSGITEGSAALGATRAQTLLRVMFPYAVPNILTALLIATGIALGETAPLIYTAGWSNYMPSLALTHSPVGYLTYVVWTFINQPFCEVARPRIRGRDAADAADLSDKRRGPTRAREIHACLGWRLGKSG